MERILRKKVDNLLEDFGESFDFRGGRFVYEVELSIQHELSKGKKKGHHQKSISCSPLDSSLVDFGSFPVP